MGSPKVSLPTLMILLGSYNSFLLNLREFTYRMRNHSFVYDTIATVVTEAWLLYSQNNATCSRYHTCNIITTSWTVTIHKARIFWKRNSLKTKKWSSKMYKLHFITVHTICTIIFQNKFKHALLLIKKNLDYWDKQTCLKAKT